MSRVNIKHAKHWHIITEMEVNPFNGEPIWSVACRCGWFGKDQINQAAAVAAYAHHLVDSDES
jgi:starvation-inducible outer membrane lipoprotein